MVIPLDKSIFSINSIFNNTVLILSWINFIHVYTSSQIISKSQGHALYVKVHKAQLNIISCLAYSYALRYKYENMYNINLSNSVFVYSETF